MPRRKRIVKIVCLLVAVGLTLWVGLRGAYRGRELQRRLICAANVKGIGTAAMIYATLWNGTTPIIDWLVTTAGVDATSTRCPCADSPNYVVVTAPLAASKANRPMDHRMIIAYEPKSNHGGAGGNVLYADGHASFILVPEYDELVQSVAKADP